MPSSNPFEFICVESLRLYLETFLTVSEWLDADAHRLSILGLLVRGSGNTPIVAHIMFYQQPEFTLDLGRLRMVPVSENGVLQRTPCLPMYVHGGHGKPWLMAREVFFVVHVISRIKCPASERVVHQCQPSIPHLGLSYVGIELKTIRMFHGVVTGIWGELLDSIEPYKDYIDQIDRYD